METRIMKFLSRVFFSRSAAATTPPPALATAKGMAKHGKQNSSFIYSNLETVV